MDAKLDIDLLINKNARNIISDFMICPNQGVCTCNEGMAHLGNDPLLNRNPHPKNQKGQWERDNNDTWYKQWLSTIVQRYESYESKISNHV